VRRAACLVLMCACASSADRRALIVGAITPADEPPLAVRPQLVEGKYARMGAPRDAYYRGSPAVYAAGSAAGRVRSAASDVPPPAPLVVGIGDAHVENFGVLFAADGSPALEPNDFDSAERVPYLWDVRRLATGIALVGGAPAARAAALAYANEIA